MNGAFIWLLIVRVSRDLPRLLAAEDNLISRVGLPQAEVATLSKDEAVARLQSYWLQSYRTHGS
jgi:hypothetical protein